MLFMLFSTLGLSVAVAPLGPSTVTAQDSVIKVAGKTAKTEKSTDEEGFLLNLEPLPSDLETSKDFDSRPVGQRKKWQFDTGYFDFDDRKSGLIEPGDNSQNYSGIRFRRPSRK
jgi:hypothetical protein